MSESEKLPESILGKLPIKSQIGRYHVEINTDDGKSTYCHVSDNLRRPSVTASLACLEGEGGFESDDGSFVEIKERDLKKIAEWASSTGCY